MTIYLFTDDYQFIRIMIFKTKTEHSVKKNRVTKNYKTKAY